VTQHAELDRARWERFSLDQQILMVGNEMNRARRLLAPDQIDSLRLAYERALRLTDLTIAVASKPTLRRELLRWRELLGELYVAPDRHRHEAAFRCLLQLTPGSSSQVALLFDGSLRRESAPR
jgi:hypothetical protein